MSSNKKFLVVLNSLNENGQSSILALHAKKRLEENGWEGVVLDLNKTPIAHLNTKALGEFFLKEDSDGEFNKNSKEYIKQLFDVQLLVLAAPMYNFGISSTLKSWIDHIARAGKTFSYTDKGPVGHLNHLKALVLQTSGGDYSSEQMSSWEHVKSYLNIILRFMGIENIKSISLGGTAGDGLDDRRLVALSEIDNFVKQL